MRIALAFCLALFTGAALADEPSVVRDGRTWVWSEHLGMYRPDGAGWQWDVDRGTFWRWRDPWARPRAGEPVERTDPDTGKLWRFNGEVWRHRPHLAPVMFQQPFCPPGGT